MHKTRIAAPTVTPYTGNEQVGQAAEILALFAHDDAATP